MLVQQSDGRFHIDQVSTLTNATDRRQGLLILLLPTAILPTIQPSAIH